MQADETENYRRAEVNRINSAVEGSNEATERARLEAKYGKENVFDTAQVREQFEVISFAAPYCLVRRKSDGKKGDLEFQHSPRFYFNFMVD
jgi:hypothetical protein